MSAPNLSAPRKVGNIVFGLLAGFATAMVFARPAWLYRAFGWLALVELLLWGYTVVRAI